MALIESKGVEGAVTETLTINCDVTAIVGNLVRLSYTVQNKVDVATDNNNFHPIIGRIKRKLSPTICSIVLSGVVDTPGLTEGKMYLSASGDFTVIVPTVGYQQILGYSFGNDKAHLQPNTAVIKLS